MTRTLYAICRGEVLTPERCDAYRASWERLKGSLHMERRTAKRLPPARQSRAQTAATIDPLTLLNITDTQQVEMRHQVESNGVLFGDFIASVTKAIGIPPCGGCKKRQEWLNAAHQRLQAAFSEIVSGGHS